MKKLRLPSISLTLLGTSVVAFGIIIGLGALIKKIELTIWLLVLPILLSAASDIISVVSLARKEGRKTQLIFTMIISSLLTIFMLLFTLMLRGLWKFT